MSSTVWLNSLVCKYNTTKIQSYLMSAVSVCLTFMYHHTLQDAPSFSAGMPLIFYFKRQQASGKRGEIQYGLKGRCRRLTHTFEKRDVHPHTITHTMQLHVENNHNSLLAFLRTAAFSNCIAL